MLKRLTKTCCSADLNLVQDAIGALSIVVMLVTALHVPAIL